MGVRRARHDDAVESTKFLGQPDASSHRGNSSTRGKVSGQRGRGVRLDRGADVFNRDREPGLVTAHQDYLVNPGGLRKVAGVHQADPART